MKLQKSMETFGSDDFESVLKREIEALPVTELPLQQALTQSSYVSEQPVNVVILKVGDAGDCVRARVGIFYAGINAGSCCADDPTRVEPQTEYCELGFDIDKKTADAVVQILS